MRRVARVLEPGKLEIVDLEHAALGPGQARLQIEAVGICGSDVALMAGTHPYAVYPVIPGHELGGRVLEASAGSQFKPGQRVAVRPTLSCGVCPSCRDARPNHCPEIRVLGVHLDGGMAEEMIAPLELLYPVESRLSAAHAAMVEPTAVAVHACRLAGLQAGMSLAVIGSGVIGMLAIQVARAWGCGPILAIDRLASRLKICRALGVDATVNNTDASALDVGTSLCPGGFDVVMDMVGRQETLSDAAALAARGGTIVPVALPHQAIQFDFEPLYRKELRIQSSRLYNGDYNVALALIASGKVHPDVIITHHFPLADVRRAFTLLAEHPEQAIKVIIEP
jgi:2-desacetyl-2-hydroxyethyl bacteriochlorophyllide A dehydrogenase